MDNHVQELTAAATAEIVQQIISTFTLNESHEVNKDKLAKFQHKELVETVTYLKTKGEIYPTLVQILTKKKIPPTKGPLASDICEFLEQLKKAECLACKLEYLPVSAENATDNKISCQICTRLCHKNCYDDSIVNPDIGVYYVCNLCSINFKQFKIVQVVEEETREGEGEATEENERIPDAQPDRRDNQETCPLLLEQRCPYGLKGDGCGFKHPKSCYYYTKFGDDPRMGCRRGNRCKFVHPKLCSNSVNMKICLNENCKQVHLKGTQRKKPRYYETNTQQNQTRQVSPWESSQPNHPAVNVATRSYNQTEENSRDQQYGSQPVKQREDRHDLQTFLAQCLEKMKTDLSTHLERQIECKINSFAAKTAQENQNQTQWATTSHQSNGANHAFQPPQEAQHQGQQTAPPVTFMYPNYQMIIPKKQ